MSVFAFVEITVKDQETYANYQAHVPALIASYGGSYLVRSSRVFPVSGDWSPDRMIVIKFASLDDLRRCFESAEYKRLAALRERSTVTRSLVVEDEG